MSWHVPPLGDRMWRVTHCMCQDSWRWEGLSDVYTFTKKHPQENSLRNNSLLMTYTNQNCWFAQIITPYFEYSTRSSLRWKENLTPFPCYRYEQANGTERGQSRGKTMNQEPDLHSLFPHSAATSSPGTDNMTTSNKSPQPQSPKETSICIWGCN